MLKNKELRKLFSLVLSFIIVFGSFGTFVHAENNHLSSVKVDLNELAKNKLEADLLKDMDNEDLVEVLVYLSDQVDTEVVASNIETSLSSAMTPYQTKLEVRRGVVEALRDKSEMTQMNMLSYLEGEIEKGNVEEFTAYHIVNMVYVKATKEVVENISFMNEVEKIYKNKTHMQDVPTMENEIEPSLDGLEWNIERVRANETWDLGFDGTGAVVANIDSGVQWDHPALKDKWRGYDPSTGATSPNENWFDPVYGATLPADSDAHGTHVMGTMVGQEADGSNKIGVAPGAKWIAARVFNAGGSTTDRILLDAAEWIIAPGGNSDAAPDVVNNSWGGGSGIDDFYRQAVTNWRSAGIVPVFSAGNQRAGEPAPWPGSISVPSNYPESFAVAAIDNKDIRAYFSKLGPSPYDESIIKPDISGPGVDVRSSVPGGYAGGWSGTSMSAPAVSGAVALLVSANSSLTVDEIENMLKDTADPLTDSTYPQAPNMGYGYGMVDTFEAVSLVASGTGSVSGRVLVPGEDSEDPVVIHEQEIFETYSGANIEILAEISDDVAITEVELLVKAEGKSYWMQAPMNLVAGDYKNGTYKGTITPDMLKADSVLYKIKVRDFAGEVVVTENHKIDIVFGIIPGEYTQGFETNPNGWILQGSWDWGIPTGDSPEAYEGEGLAGTNISGPYPNNADDWMISPPFDLRDASLEAASLRFHEWHEMENNWDKGYLLITDDYGENWTEVRPFITGDQMEWKGSFVNLAEYVGSENPVFVAFRFTSDGSGQRRGWFVDNARLMGEDNEAPALPTEFNAEATLGGIRLTWNESADADVSHYKIYRSEISGEDYTEIGNVRGRLFLDNEIEVEQTYHYVMTAIDYAGNESEYSEELSIVAPNVVTIFKTNFEDDDGGFTTGTTESDRPNNWELGIPTSGPRAALTGTRVWATNLTGQFDANHRGYIESPEIVIPEGLVSYISFNHWIDAEQFSSTGTMWDYGNVQVSNDDGETWADLTGRIGGHIKDWRNKEVNLEEYAGQTIKIRFFFYSDFSGNFDGWYIDDVLVAGVESQELDKITMVEPVKINEYEEEKQLDKPEKKEFKEPEIDFKLNNQDITLESTYKTISNAEVENMPMIFVGIPAKDAVVTVLETGRSVRVDPTTGKYFMRTAVGEYTLKTEAYGYFPKEMNVTIEEDENVRANFVLEPKPQGTITGRVVDRYDGTPAAYAKLRLVEDPKIEIATADENGYFTMENVYEGTYTVKVGADGFEPGQTTVTVVGDEVTDVLIELKRFVGYEDEIIYDDGTAEDALVLNAAGYGLAVRFTPEEFGKVKGTNVFFWGNDWPIPGGNRIGFVIYDENQNQIGEPIFQDIVRDSWNYIDLLDFGFTTDEDFYISTIQEGPGTENPGTGIDENSPHGDRSYMNLGGEFELISSEGIQGGLMIRAIMEYSIDTPIITSPEALTYTNQDVIMVEGTSTADGKINVYVNDVKVDSVETVEKAFAVEVEIPEDRSEIRVTAEMNGKETEPSETVVVIKDKEAPVLIVEKPLDNARINVETVHVVGNATDDINLVKVEVNGEEVDVDEEGSFHERLLLDPGENLITVKASDGAGNESTVTRTVFVELEVPGITNLLPDEDVELRAGEVLTVSFNAPSGGEGYFRLLFPFGLESNEVGIPMTEVDGLYTGTWIVPERLVITGLKVQAIYISEYGNKTVEIAEGKVTVIGDMENLVANSIIIGEEAFDMDYLNSNSYAQRKLLEWTNSGEEIFLKLNNETIVTGEGQMVTINELPSELTHYDMDGNITYYQK